MIDLARFPERTDNVDVGAERNLLACIVKTADAWLKLPDGFSSDEFAVPLNRALFSVIDSIYGKGAVVDVVTVYEALPKDYQDELDTNLGGWSYIQALQDLPISPNNVVHEAHTLLDRSTRRRIGRAANRILELSTVPEPLDKIREGIEVAISEIDKTEGTEVVNIGSKGLEFIEKRMAAPTEVPGLPSGFTQLDKAIQGFQSSRLYVVGARMKTGKSMLLLNWAKHLAVDNNIPILWISTEHSQDDEFSRLLSLTSEVQENLINNGIFSEVELYTQRVGEALTSIKGAPFHFASMPMFNLQKIKQLTRKMVRVHGVKALFFDFIKTPESETNNKEWQELGALTYGLKALGAAEDIPIITAAQVNREGANSFKLDGEIDVDHFGGSDRIAQAMSVGLVLRKPTKVEANDPDIFRVLRVARNRHGAEEQKYLINFEGEIIKMSECKRL